MAQVWGVSFQRAESGPILRGEHVCVSHAFSEQGLAW